MRRPDGSGTLDMDLAAPGGMAQNTPLDNDAHIANVLTDQAAHVILRTREETALLTVDPVSRGSHLGQAPQSIQSSCAIKSRTFTYFKANPQVNLHVRVKSGQRW